MTTVSTSYLQHQKLLFNHILFTQSFKLLSIKTHPIFFNHIRYWLIVIVAGLTHCLTHTLVHISMSYKHKVLISICLRILFICVLWLHISTSFFLYFDWFLKKRSDFYFITNNEDLSLKIIYFFENMLNHLISNRTLKQEGNPYSLFSELGLFRKQSS